MKKNILITWMSLLATLFLAGGCIPDDLNNDPTTSTRMSPELQITTVQLLPSNEAEEWHRYLIYPGGFMNHWCNDWALVTYGSAGAKSDPYFAQMWNSYYAEIINEVVDLIERTRNVPHYLNYHAIGKILSVENFLRLTDFYGDIPYFNAGKAYYSGIFKPAYDKQEDIYNDFLLQLKEACQLFNPEAAIPTSADLYYDGNLEKWKKYANSLRVRIAMRLVKVNPALAKAEVEDAVAAGVFTSNDDICYVQHDNVRATERSAGNGIANRLLADNKSSTFRISKELIGTMEDTRDPRVPFYAGSYLEDIQRTDITDKLLALYDGSYKNIALGAQLFNYSDEGNIKAPVTIEVNGGEVVVSALLQYMQPSKLITDPASPSIRMSYAELEFLLAEAAYRGYNVGDIEAVRFKRALEAAVRQWTLYGAKIDEAALQNFLTHNQMQLKKGNELAQINTQLWILHFLDPMEAWANWRRTGLPDIRFYNYHPALNESQGKTPRRIQYPISEQTSNAENYRVAVDRMGSDDWLNRVWWDKE